MPRAEAGSPRVHLPSVRRGGSVAAGSRPGTRPQPALVALGQRHQPAPRGSAGELVSCVWCKTAADSCAKCTQRRVIGGDSRRLASGDHPDRRILLAVPVDSRFVYQTKCASTNGSTARVAATVRSLDAMVGSPIGRASIGHADRYGTRDRAAHPAGTLGSTGQSLAAARTHPDGAARASSATAVRMRRRAGRPDYPRRRPSSKRRGSGGPSTSMRGSPARSSSSAGESHSSPRSSVSRIRARRIRSRS